MATRLNLLETKLNSINPHKTTYEINQFKDFIGHNKNKILNVPTISDKLLASLNRVNLIKDNIELGEDNTENFAQLNILKDEMESLLKPGHSETKSLEDRIKAETKRSAEKVVKETERVAHRVNDELHRVTKKLKKLKF